ncbi:OB-fold putative lipoprotein, partial [Escherichia coli]|nr:OB-fold putative lipoprotein [Escherichia coli]
MYNTTARQLFKEYEENEVATDEQLKGKLIAVRGIVQSIDKDFTDSI